MKTTKTILITSFHVLISRNILAAPFLDVLKREGWKIIIVCPQKKETYFKKEFGSDQILIEGVTNKLTRIDDLFKDLAYRGLQTNSVKLMRKRNMGIERPWAQKIFFFAPLIKSIIPFLYRVCISKNAFSDVFLKYNPDIIFSTDVFSAHDCRLIVEGKKHHVPVVAMVRSWDNLTGKGGFRAIPDVLVVQNDILRKEARVIHGISDTIIRTVGIPHYDRYIDAPTLDRSSFLKQLGMPKDARYIVYAPIGDRIVKIGDQVHPHTYDRDMIMLLEKYLPSDTYLLVRYPPTDTVSMDTTLLSSKVIFQKPGTRFGDGVKGIRASEMSKEDDRLLMDTLYHASVLVNPFSSLVLDAIFMNRPVITPRFDITEFSYLESAMRFGEFEHFAYICSSEGTRVVYSPTELREAINLYLASPNLDEKARLELASQECYAVDNHASERLMGVLKEVIRR